MLLFPAIDLKDGQCVRLYKGDMTQATIFSDNPAEQAASFALEGADWLHIVDLNGAFAGRSVNTEAVKSILQTTSLNIQLGGGIRSLKHITYWLEAGVERVILGTAALRSPDLVKEACKLFPGKIIVGIDARNGMVAVEGWSELSKTTVEELALKFEDAGVSAIIYTNIDQDGTMEGPDIPGTSALAEKISIPVIASGGVSSLADLRKLKTIERLGVIGIISGRAIYDKKINIKEAVRILATATDNA